MVSVQSEAMNKKAVSIATLAVLGAVGLGLGLNSYYKSHNTDVGPVADASIPDVETKEEDTTIPDTEPTEDAKTPVVEDDNTTTIETASKDDSEDTVTEDKTITPPETNPESTPEETDSTTELQPSKPELTPPTITPQKPVVKPKREAPFDGVVSEVASAKPTNNRTGDRPVFEPDSVDFNAATKADIYVDMEYYQGDENHKSWLDIQMETSIEYSQNKGIYIYSIIGNRNGSKVSNKLREQHKIVYLVKKDNKWKIDEGYLYDYSHSPYEKNTLKVVRQDTEMSEKGKSTEIEFRNLCGAHDTCGDIKSEGIKKWSGHYTLNDNKSTSNSEQPPNPFSLQKSNDIEYSAGWKSWYWSSNQYYFNGYYEDGEWKTPKDGMYMGWLRVLLITGGGNWKKVCSSEDGQSCGLNSSVLSRAAS